MAAGFQKGVLCLGPASAKTRLCASSTFLADCTWGETDGSTDDLFDSLVHTMQVMQDIMGQDSAKEKLIQQCHTLCIAQVIPPVPMYGGLSRAMDTALALGKAVHALIGVLHIVVVVAQAQPLVEKMTEAQTEALAAVHTLARLSGLSVIHVHEPVADVPRHFTHLWELVNTRPTIQDGRVGVGARCDWMITQNTTLVRNVATDQPRSVYITNNINPANFLFFVRTVLPCLTKPVKVVLAGEDQTFPSGSGDLRHKPYRGCEAEIAHVLQHPMVRHVFVENLDDATSPDRMSPIPVGVLDNCFSLHWVWPCANWIPFQDRPHQVLCCNRTRHGTGQFALRRYVQDLATGEGPWAGFVHFRNEDLSHAEFLANLAQSRFCLCPHGGGIDPSPKAWEALMMGCIPIIQRSALDAAYSPFPVVFIDDWVPEAITPTKLSAWLEELRPVYEDPLLRKQVLGKLTLTYWWNNVIMGWNMDGKND